MRTLMLSSLLLFTIANSGAAEGNIIDQRGVGSSGGAKSVVCRDANKNIISTQILDLYEAKELRNENLKNPLGTLTQEYVRFLGELRRVSDDSRPVSKADRDQFKRDFSKTISFKKHKLKKLNDVKSIPKLASGCELEQFAIYNDNTHKISVNQEIWNHSSSLDQIALWAHEVFYFMNRRVGASYSDVSRKTTAQFFTALAPNPTKEGVPLDSPSCWTNSNTHQFQFFVYDNPNNENSIIQVQQVGGRYPYSKFTAKLDFAIDLKQTKIGAVGSELALIVTDPSAFNEQSVMIDNYAYEGYKLGVRYFVDEAMAVNFVDPEGKIVSADTIFRCSK